MDLDELTRRMMDRYPLITRTEARGLVVTVLSDLRDIVFGDDEGHHSAVRARLLNRMVDVLGRADQEREERQ